MTKYTLYFLKTIIRITLILFGIFLAFKLYHSWIDPVNVLEKKSILKKVIDKNSYISHDLHGKRVYTDVILDTGGAKNAHFTISLPEKIPANGLKCIFVASGLDTGRKSLDYIRDQSNYAVIAYEYPSLIRTLKNRSLILKVRQLREKILTVPQQWISIILWIEQQQWCKKEPISIVGFSFGSIFVPATYHLAQVENVQLGPGVIGYGGAGLLCLLKANLKLPKLIKSPVAWLTSILLRPIDPLVHAKYLQNSFLIINGLNDKMIPSKCRKKIQEIIPEPKKIINLKTEHMMPSNQALLDELIEITKDFFENQNVKTAETTALTNASEFLPNTVNQTPPKIPILLLKLYSIAGANWKLSC